MPSISKTILSALLLAASVLALPTPQLAGEGQAANSVFSATDNGVGFSIEHAEGNLAGNVADIKGALRLPALPNRRQLDKIANGGQTLSEAAGTGRLTSGLTTTLDKIDGDTTSGAANLGATVGQTEGSTLIDFGSAFPRK